MTISHHLDDATIIAHAAGSLGEAMGIVVATHLAFCPECRDALRRAENIGGALMNEAKSNVSSQCKAETLERLMAATMSKPETKAPSRSGLPFVLANRMADMPISELPWKKKAPGISVYDVPMSKNAKGQLKLLSIAPGKSMPEHGHGGEELTLILSGSYSDHTGKYIAGDVADLDEEIEHTPVVDSDTPCICLIATEAPTRFKSVFARLMQPFVGI